MPLPSVGLVWRCCTCPCKCCAYPTILPPGKLLHPTCTLSSVVVSSPFIYSVKSILIFFFFADSPRQTPQFHSESYLVMPILLTCWGEWCEVLLCLAGCCSILRAWELSQWYNSQGLKPANIFQAASIISSAVMAKYHTAKCPKCHAEDISLPPSSALQWGYYSQSFLLSCSSSCCSCSWDHWQPAVNYSSLQVSVTYVRVWQHRIKVLHLFCKPLAVLFHWHVHPSALPFLVSLLPIFWVKTIFSLESYLIAVLHLSPSWKSLKEKCLEYRLLPCSPMRPGTSCYCSETLRYPMPPDLREGAEEGSFQWEICGKEEGRLYHHQESLFSCLYLMAVQGEQNLI